MSAVNAKVQEPSMDEILASIRRIIADDQTAREGDIPMPEVKTFAPEPVSAAPLVPEPALAAQPSAWAAPDQAAIDDLMAQDDVLDLADHPEFAAPADDIDFRDVPLGDPPPSVDVQEAWSAPQPEPESEPVLAGAPSELPPAPPVAPAEPLISRNTDAAVSAAFSSLANTILTHNARTLEDLVGDMLRPMLKTWLDDNLPVIVERLVRAEIERVARGGR